MRKIPVILTLIFVFLMLHYGMDAQCPMCSMAAESNLEAGGNVGKGLNSGILYMFAAPYLIVGTIAYFWWKNRRVYDEDDSIDLLDE